MMQLNVDEALLRLQSDLLEPIKIFVQIDECYECPPTEQIGVVPNKSIVLNTKYNSLIEVKSATDALMCSFPYQSYQDHSTYQLTINETTSSAVSGNQSIYNCQLTQLETGRNNILPFILIAMLYIIFLIAIKIGRHFLSLISRDLAIDEHALTTENDTPALVNDNEVEPASETSPIPASPQSTARHAKHRLQALDAFRGITIMLMIFVNYGGGGYALFEHKPWYGLTIADLVFPWFIFIMGMSISLAVRREVMLKTPLRTVLLRIVERSLSLFLLGLCLNSLKQSSLTKIRIPGVLQRFSISYFVVASVHYLNLVRIERPFVPLTTPTRSSLRTHFLMFWWEWLIMSLLAGLYLFLTFLWTYDEACPRGYQGPGGLHQHGLHFNCTGGAANFLDQMVFGREHMYPRSFAEKIYSSTMSHDPEGLLGTTTSIILTFLGLEAGKVLLSFSRARDRLAYWMLWAALLGIFGGIISATGAVPIVKNLWSLSYISLTGSLAFISLSVIFVLTDLTCVWTGHPFAGAGKNSILLYMGHMVLKKMFPFYYDVDESSHYLLLLRTTAASAIWLVISLVLHRKKIYFSV